MSRRVAVAAAAAAALAVGGSVPAACAAPASPAQAVAEEGVAVTVYSAPGGGGQPQNVFDPMRGQWVQSAPGFAVVKERRKMALRQGRNSVRFDRVAARIDGSTVIFRSLTDPAGTTVLEQGFEYDLADANRILERYLDRPIAVHRNNQASAEGTLLSFDHGQLVLRDPSGAVRIVRRDENIREIVCGDLPGGLVTKPTLAWLVNAGQAGEHLIETAYETSNMGWEADYTAVISADEKTADLSAWVTIRNQSGASYENAALKLVAGDVHRAPQQPGHARGAKMAREAAFAASEDGGFTEKAFFEYHLYTLGRRTTIPDRSLKQIELFDAVRAVPVRKVYLYDGLRDQPWWGGGGPNMDQGWGSTGSPKVGVFLELENRKDHGLGIPLPAGRMRVQKRDEADGFPELVGEDAIDHTPKDEKVRLKMGDAFDLVGERRQMDFQVDHGARWIRESYEIKVRNHKAEAVDVLVAERMYRWVTWNVERKNRDFVKKDSQLVHFPISVP
ncbi:MAG TPA: DUF4139 domain-containing protein, partial [Planctomycetota bacterium]|nr:DUF4139 domain-containing protein [Planctomycetota bacterium]